MKQTIWALAAVVSIGLFHPALAQVAVPREPMQITPLPAGTITLAPADAAAATKAQAKSTTPDTPAPDGTAAIHQDGELVLTKSFCTNLITYVPSADVAYKPGVDVYGHPVAPADLPGQQSYPLANPIQTAIILNTARLAQIPSIPGRSETYPAFIAVDPNTGAVSLNGRPIQQTDEATLAKLCRDRGLSH